VDFQLIENDWRGFIEAECQKEYFTELQNRIDMEYRTKSIFPQKDEVFNSLKYTTYENVKCVLLGQDPYATRGFAHGLAFSTKLGVSIPKSLRNIYKELNDDLKCYCPNNGYLKKWAVQGVLLLNTILTVEEGKPNSHKGYGWEKLTDKIISAVNEKKTPVVFLLWGNNAREKKALINNPRHLIIESAHPSPLSANRGFFGSRPFSRTNKFLIDNGIEPIDWQIENA
jgi:uracil-DNA glycosylase